MKRDRKLFIYRAITIGLALGYCFLLYQFSKQSTQYNACLSGQEKLHEEFNLGGGTNE